MSGEHFLIFIGLPFTVAVLGLLSWRIATSKGRSGWWALAGLGFHIGLIVVLALPVVRRSRPGKVREPDEPDDDATPRTGSKAEGSRGDEAKPVPRPVRHWNSQLLRRPRVGWRTNGFLYLFELHIALIMCGWLAFGCIGGVVFMVQTILGVGTVSWDGVPTDSVVARFGVAAAHAFFGVCGAVYLFNIRPGLIARSERDSRRRPRR